MPQGVLPFKYEMQQQGKGLTGLAGLPVYMDLPHRMRIAELIDTHVGLRPAVRGGRTVKR